jgi:3-demethoxyubiquinol 3-hydroxylase
MRTVLAEASQTIGRRLSSSWNAAAVTHASVANQAGGRSALDSAHALWRGSERFHRLAMLSSPVNSPDPERKRSIDRMIRVDHAGETAAVKIYQGQVSILPREQSIAGGHPFVQQLVLGHRKDTAELLEHMRKQEVKHLEEMNELVTDRRVRPSALLPVWEAAGLALGVGTALLGRDAAMACTVAVEEVIGGHYNDQIRELLERGWDEEELLATLKKNRDEELEHLHTAEKEGAADAPLHGPLTGIIKAGCQAAIEVAKRV